MYIELYTEDSKEHHLLMMMKSFMVLIRFKSYDLHYPLYITCYLLLGIRIYLHFRDLLYSLRIKCETLPHQEADTCYDQIRYYELSKRNNLE